MGRARKLFVAALGGVALATLIFVATCHGCADTPSTCFGSPKNGKLRHGWRLPISGPNFTAYSVLGWALGRTYLHSSVHPVVLDAYAALAERLPSRHWVYGETGWVFGGRFAPHKTHQNGLSVDFFVPVQDHAGAPSDLPANVSNRFGYDVDFDATGKNADSSIDFEALAEHLRALRAVAKQHGVHISRVILAPDLQPELRATRAWPQIRDLPFSQRPSWVRHDDHYHVDFAVACEPLPQAR